MMDKKSLAKFCLGSTIIAVSSGFGLVRSYNGDLILTLSSLGLFMIGFRICQTSLSNHDSVLPSNLANNGLGKANLKNAVFFSVGGLLMSQGFIFLTAAISSQNMYYSITGGLLMLGGYLPAHLAVNKTII